MSSPLDTPIAVVGVSALFPGSVDKDGFWRDILAGRDLLTDVPPSHWLIEDYYDADPRARDKTYARRGGFLPEVDFDPLAWGIPPSNVPATDTTQLLALIVAQQVLEDACGAQFKNVPRERTSVILGVTSAQELLGSMVSRLQRPVWVKALREMGLGEDQVVEAAERIASHYVEWQESTFPGVLGNVVAGRIANRLDLGGTNCVTDAACASSFSALAMAVSELRLGQSDLVIAGGADTMNDIFMYVCFSKTPALSPTGDCRPFSASADGTMLGEGIGMVALKRLADAERDGDRIYAVVKGVGSSSDGRAKSVYAPVPAGQANALRRAYAQAGYTPDTVELVEAHGTGTAAGDAAEFAALRQVFDETQRPDRQWCALGSVKSQVGHTKAAAGAAGLFKAVMALHHKVLPPTIKVDRPDPKLGVEASPFYLNATARPWVRDAQHPRRASVSSFGFGGSNFHVTLEEYTGRAPRPPRVRSPGGEVVLLHGADAQAVAAQCRTLAADASAGGLLAFLARSTQEAFDPGAPARLALFAESDAELAQKLTQAAELVARGGDFSVPGGLDFAVGPAAGPVAFLFPGQGSQYLRMGADLAMGFEPAHRALERSARVPLGTPERLDEVLFPRAAFDDAGREAQGDRLTATQWAQPGIGAMSLMLLEVLEDLGVAPAAVAGHSFGEVTALCAAGALTKDDLLRVARRRGELMGEAARVPGAMTSVAASREALAPLLAEWRAPVVLANHNSPNQIVLAGTVEAIADVERRLSERGLGTTRLQVATAFHSPLVSPARGPFREFLAGLEVSPPRLPVIACASAAPYPEAPDAVRDALAQQLVEPVRFVEQIEALYARGVRVFLEVGPGRVLTGLVGHILKQRPHRAIALDRRGASGVRSLAQGLGLLSVAGVPVDYQRLWAPFAPVEDPRTRKKPAMTLKVCGSSYGKPYPPRGGAAALPRPNPAARPATPVSLPAATEVPPPPPAPAPPADPATTLAWVQAFQESQRQTAEAHAAFQRAMAESHAAFLRSADTSLQELTALLGQGPGRMDAPPREQPALPAWEPPVIPVVPQATQAMPPAPAGRASPMESTVVAVAPAAVAAPAPRAPVAPQPAAPARGPSPAELEALLLGVVAEKTGYPKEMIGLDMDLEADLGVDSIKRVQILSAMDRVPGLPEVPPNRMATLRTLRQISDFLGAALATSAPPAGPAPALAPLAAAAPQPAAPARGPSPAELEALLLGVVAEKTGYPKEMIGLDMDLEADLGVDSIKRVQILSAMDRVPGLPEVPPNRMATLRTLRQISDFLGAALTSSAPSASAPPSAPVTSAPPAPAAHTASPAELEALLLGVVAEKTGYPREMIGLDMDLEADLGVDSIKRVQILSAMDRVPGLPEVPPNRMATLRTLRQISNFLGAALTSSAPSASAPPRAPVASAPTPARPSPLRLAVVPVAAPASGLGTPGLFRGQRCVVTDDGRGVGAALVAELETHGARATLVQEVPAEPDVRAVVCLSGLSSFTDEEEALAANRAAFAAARAVAQRFAEEGGTFITVQDTGGDFGLSGSERAWLAGPAALARTAQAEWPRATVRALDVEGAGRAPRELAQVICRELLAGGLEPEVGLMADGRRLTLATTPAPLPDGARPPLAPQYVVVASGGARGVTARCLLELARAAKCRFLLLGRTALTDASRTPLAGAELKRQLLAEATARGEHPTPRELARRAEEVEAAQEIRRTLAAIDAAGGQARYVALDVTDPAAVRAAVADARRAWGPIGGVVHGAGVLADKRLEAKTDAQWERVFRTKVDGLHALLEATRDDELAFVQLFSSVAARWGNPGQADYAMANEVLNKVAAVEQRRRGPACRVRALGWGPWDGGMVDAGLKEKFATTGVPLLGLDEGAALFARELTAQDGSPEVLLLAQGSGDHPPGRLAPTAPREVITADLHVDRETYPFLDGHRVQGTAVVPVALVLEWFGRLAHALRPDLTLTSCHDVQVLKGIRLPDFERGGEALSVRARLIAGAGAPGLEFELLGADGTKHYRARGVLEPRAPGRAGAEPAVSGLTPWTHPLYDGEVLFHGEAFHLIEAVEGVSDAAMTARVVGLQRHGWPGAWCFDPGLLDAGLQLALLWTAHRTGRAGLPTAIEAVRFHAAGPHPGQARYVLRGREAARERSLCDLICVAPDGTPLAELRGVEVHLLPQRIDRVA